MEAINLQIPKTKLDCIIYKNSTELRMIFQDLIQKLINHNQQNKNLLEDIRFLIFDYIDNYEYTISEGENNESI